VTIEIETYVAGVEEIKAAKTGGDPQELSASETHACRGVLAKARWPVSHVAPELAYVVGSLAQASPRDLSGGREGFAEGARWWNAASCHTQD
jgi:hypothetical protein